MPHYFAKILSFNITYYLIIHFLRRKIKNIYSFDIEIYVYNIFFNISKTNFKVFFVVYVTKVM